MLRLLSLLLFGAVALFAAEHYARVEPWERSTIKAAAAGQVLEANLSLEGTLVKDARVVHLDDRLDRKDLSNAEASEKIVQQTLELTRQMLPGLQESARRQKGYFERISKLSTASQTQKDQAYQAMVAAQNQYLSTKEKALSLRQNLLDLEYKIAMLEDRIAKKNLRLKNRYLYRLLVRSGEFAGVGTPLAIVDDLSRQRLTIYLSSEEIKRLPKLHIYLDGKIYKGGFDRIWRESDDKYLSSYRAELWLPAGKFPLSRLVKVELK